MSIDDAKGADTSRGPGTGPRSVRGLWMVCFWLAVVASVVVSLLPAPPPLHALPGTDKIEHALAFTALAVLGHKAGYRRVPWLLIGLVCLGGAIELAQGWFTATRTAEWLDWVSDGVGTVLGMGLSRRWLSSQGHPD